MKYLYLITALLLMCLLPAQGKKKQEDPVIKNLEQELRSLEKLKLEKTDDLERAEADRWDQRYRQSVKKREHEERARSLESVYTRLANELSRKQDNLVREGNTAREAESEWEDADLEIKSFNRLLAQAIDQSAEKLSADIPVNISQRTLELSDLSQKVSKDKVKTGTLLEEYFKVRGRRYSMTGEQMLSRTEGLFGNSSVPVWQLRLGTVFLGEMASDNHEKTQILLRTGKLQGKVFVWRDQLAGEANAAVASAVLAASRKETSAVVPMDILQNKSLGSGFIEAEDITAWGAVVIWFKKGGLVMYPLIFSALLGLLLSLERLIVLFGKSANTRRFMNTLAPMVDKIDKQEALSFCEKSRTSLAQCIGSILSQSGKSRTAAEKAVNETVLREVPILEKRMVLIAAIGGSAPLMGLLGTVSGMISLFKVITDVGTNDPRILAGGISEALVTTQTGLVIAIPILLIHGYLTDRTERIQNDITTRSMEVLNKLWPEG